MPNEKRLIDLSIETILSMKTKEGMINFTLKTEDNQISTQWDIPKAKHILNMLHEAVEAAISDAMVYQFMRKEVGLSDEKASMVVHNLREYRQGTMEIVNPN